MCDIIVRQGQEYISCIIIIISFLAPRESCGYLQGEAIIEVHIQVYID